MAAIEGLILAFLASTLARYSIDIHLNLNYGRSVERMNKTLLDVGSVINVLTNIFAAINSSCKVFVMWIYLENFKSNLISFLKLDRYVLQTTT